jgi:hypothetical protein
MQKNPNAQRRSNSADTPKWAAARELVESGTTLEVNVDSIATNGNGRPCGLNVTVSGLPAFLPGSELPKGIKQSDLVGKPLTVKVLEANRRKGRLIVSRSVVVASEQTDFLGSLAEGQEVQAVVARKTDFGYFCNVGPVDALLHNTQVPFATPGVIRELNIGETITAKVRTVDLEKSKLSITMRQPRPEGERGRNGGGRSHGNSGNGGGNGGNYGRNNVERFQRRHERPAVSFTSKSTTPAPAPQPTMRKLNTKSNARKRDQFSVSFTGFEALGAWYKEQHGGAEAAPEVTENTVAPTTGEAVAPADAK